MNLLLVPEHYIDARIFRLQLKPAACAVLSAAILWYPFSMPPLRGALYPLLPLAAALLPFALNEALAALLPSAFAGGRTKMHEAFFAFAIVFLSIKEGLSFIDALAISVSCAASFALFLFLMTAAISRLSPVGMPETRLPLPLFMVLLGIFSLIQSLFDILWPIRAFGG